METLMTDSRLNRRRAQRRSCVEDHGIVAARVRPGYVVSVIDVSAGGTLIESAHRLLPGTSVELQFETAHHRVGVRGRVLRCAIVALRSSAVCYRGAVVFERHLPWFVDEDSNEYSLPSPEHRAGHSARAAPTRPLL
ncbi:MAG: hypothetical protein DMF92_22880 [Acidobacteria bacterium]|nr:MAG: hypothetical protein DMF92_22880 [Acidobacteriota bacterium]